MLAGDLNTIHGLNIKTKKTKIATEMASSEHCVVNLALTDAMLPSDPHSIPSPNFEERKNQEQSADPNALSFEGSPLGHAYFIEARCLRTSNSQCPSDDSKSSASITLSSPTLDGLKLACLTLLESSGRIIDSAWKTGPSPVAFPVSMYRTLEGATRATHLP